MTRRTTLISTAVLLLAACGRGEQEDPAAAPGAGSSGRAAPATPATAKVDLASLPAPYQAADLENGKRQFARCRSCHTITPEGADMTGPNLHGVFGRRAGADPDYRYSEALKTAGFVWEPARLDGWLADPRGYLPGTKMSFAGVKQANDRRDLIAYLMVETGGPGG